MQKPEGELQPAFMTGTRTGLLPMLPGAMGHAGAATGLKYWGEGKARVRATMTSMVVGRSEVYILVLEGRQERL